MADTTVNVNWEIMPARETPGINANRFDQWRQGDTPIGPEPESPSAAPPETNGELGEM